MLYSPCWLPNPLLLPAQLPALSPPPLFFSLSSPPPSNEIIAGSGVSQ